MLDTPVPAKPGPVTSHQLPCVRVHVRIADLAEHDHVLGRPHAEILASSGHCHILLQPCATGITTLLGGHVLERSQPPVLLHTLAALCYRPQPCPLDAGSPGDRVLQTSPCSLETEFICCWYVKSHIVFWQSHPLGTVHFWCFYMVACFRCFQWLSCSFQLPSTVLLP